jgi:hypothetical protein
MRKVTFGCTLALLFAGLGAAQEWEVGGMASYGFYHNAEATNPTGSAVAGFSPGAAFGALVGYSTSSALSGEFRYAFEMSNLKLSSNGTSASFNGVAHVIGYDLILHPRYRHEMKIQPFLAVGGGMKLYRGTGSEQAYQPLENFALLTKTQQVEPMISFGGGIKVALSQHVMLRAEVRDYVTPFPANVIAPVSPTKINGWLNDFVPMIGVSYIF